MLYSLDMLVNQHRQVYEASKRIVVVHLNKVDVKDEDGDEDEDDGDDVEFEENEELIDMLHAVSMKEKSEHDYLKIERL